MPANEAPSPAPLGDATADPAILATLESLLRAIVDYTGALAGTVRWREAARQELRLIASVGVPAALWQHKRRVDLACGGCGATLAANQAQLAEFRCACSDAIAALGDGGPLHLLTVPLRDAQQACGVLSLFFPERTEVPVQLPPLLTAFSELIGLTLANARRVEEQMRATLQEERRILANEVHDALAQNIACMRMRTPLLRDALEQQDKERAGAYLTEVESSLAVAHARVRELITHFRSDMEPQGLLPALRLTMAELQGLGGVALTMEARMAEPSLSVDQSLQVLHIAREAMVNIVKHARAQHGCLRLEHDRDFCHVSIEDDGIGIMDPSGENSRHGHFGLNIMRERAQLLGGELCVEAGSHGGTRVCLSFPYAPPRGDSTAAA